LIDLFAPDAMPVSAVFVKAPMAAKYGDTLTGERPGMNSLLRRQIPALTRELAWWAV